MTGDHSTVEIPTESEVELIAEKHSANSYWGGEDEKGTLRSLAR